MVHTCAVWFANFFWFGDHGDHTWGTVKKAMANPHEFLKTVKNLDIDSVSGPRVKRIKNLTLFTTEQLKNNSAACQQMGIILLRIQEYYNAKDSRTQARM